MDEILKKLLESELLDKATADAIKAKVTEVEAAAESRVKKRLEALYKDDQRRLVAATEAMIKEGIDKAISDIAAERKTLSKLTAKAAKAIAEADKRAERKARKIAEALGVMVEDCLTKEMGEFHEERKAERAKTVKAIRESRASIERDRQAFIKRGAVVLETIIDGQVGAKIKELANDIREARRSDFGRKIFESFAAEFRTSFYNESAEAKKLSLKLAEATKQLKAVKAQAAKKIEVLESDRRRAVTKAKVLQEQSARGKEIASLLSRVPASGRQQMKALLEAQPTDKIRSAFKRYLPEVMGRSAPGMRKVKLAESSTRKLDRSTLVLKEGNRMTPEPKAAGGLDDLARLRAAAGIGRNH